ncbi:MAG: MFS transporter [Bifidobacteriaceae bacterium]|jgi:CP family cyanate transporter-like MFS transporter|nr:MFS transporter [Bifidobacteriaceae bacterium]
MPPAQNSTPDPAPDSASPPARSIWRGRLTALAGLVILGLNLRAAFTTVAPALNHIRAEVALSPTAESLIATAPPLMFAIFGATAPLLGRRWGLERVVAGAMTVATLGIVARALTSDGLVFLATTGLIMAGLGAANVTVPPLIKRYFPDRIGLMTTASTVFLVVGQALPPAVAVPLADRFGWRWAIGVWAVGSALSALPWVVQPYRLNRRRGRPRARPRAAKTVKVMRSPTFWGITGLLASNSVCAYALIGWLPQIMIDAGAEPRQAALWLTWLTAGSLIPALAAPTLTLRLRHPQILVVVMFVAWVVSLGGFALSPLHATWWWLILTRVGDGNYACALTLMNLRTRHPQTLLAVSGFGQAVGYTCAAVATFAFGQLHAATGAWLWPLTLLICTMPLGLVGGLVACRKTYVEDEVRGIVPPAVGDSKTPA